MWTLALVIVTVAWFLLPLLPAWWEWRHKTDVLALEVLPEHAGEVGHFAQRFREHVAQTRARSGGVAEAGEGALPTAGSGPGPGFRPNRVESAQWRVRRRVWADTDLSLPARFTFEREVYGQRNISTGELGEFSALLAEGSLQLAAGCVVRHWAHAHRIEAGRGCRLQGRLSASGTIVLQPGCSFERVSAGLVCFGSERGAGPASPGMSAPLAWKMPAGADHGDGRWRFDGDFELPAHAEVRGDIIVQGCAHIRQGARIHGSLKGARAVCLDEGVEVTGAVISGGRLIVGAGCRIGGPVAAEESVDLGSGSCLGDAARPCTVSAPVMRVGPDVKVHGTVWARRHGRVQESAGGAQ